MSSGPACQDREHRPYWFVTCFGHHHSAFAGYRWTDSCYSTVVCAKCERTWRTKANYVHGLRRVGCGPESPADMRDFVVNLRRRVERQLVNEARARQEEEERENTSPGL